MKKLGTLALTLALLAAGSVNAAEVLEETKDQTTGKSVGGMNGMMIGAIGGPIGMLVGAGVGLLVGDGAEEVAKDALSGGDESEPAEAGNTEKTTVIR